MDIENYKAFLKGLLVDDAASAISNLLEAIRKNSNAYDEAITIQAGLNVFKRKERTGQLNTEEVNVFSAQIISRILSLINSIEEDSLIQLEWVNKEKINIGASNKKSGIDKGGPNSEKFQEQSHWPHLEKIGRWTLLSDTGKIFGQGVYQFLLSSNEYGRREFTIFTSIKFNNYENFSSKFLDNVNAGIVLGWVAKEDKRRYYNLLFTGKKVLLEGVGLHGGDDYRDFVHLDNGVELQIVDGIEYRFAIKVSSKRIDLFIEDEMAYSIERPQEMYGRVGLRPWRSKIEVDYFEVIEN